MISGQCVCPMTWRASERSHEPHPEWCGRPTTNTAADRDQRTNSASGSPETSIVETVTSGWSCFHVESRTATSNPAAAISRADVPMGSACKTTNRVWRSCASRNATPKADSALGSLSRATTTGCRLPTWPVCQPRGTTTSGQATRGATCEVTAPRRILSPHDTSSQPSTSISACRAANLSTAVGSPG